MPFTPKLTYKGKPLVRKDNELYYGRMTDPYVLLPADPFHKTERQYAGSR